MYIFYAKLLYWETHKPKYIRFHYGYFQVLALYAPRNLSNTHQTLLDCSVTTALTQTQASFLKGGKAVSSSPNLSGISDVYVSLDHYIAAVRSNVMLQNYVDGSVALLTVLTS